MVEGVLVLTGENRGATREMLDRGCECCGWPGGQSWVSTTSRYGGIVWEAAVDFVTEKHRLCIRPSMLPFRAPVPCHHAA